MVKKYLLVGVLCTFACSAFSQQWRPSPATKIYQELQQLSRLGTVMYLAAHPDDENTRLISYLVHHDHIRTVYLSLTRGDGGQNILGTEQGAALGLIRTQELLQARKIDGAEQLFSPVVDFGYTKSPEETFQFWDKGRLVADVVAAIQATKPDLIICRFPTTGEGGHGQHTASAIVAEAAFTFIEKYNDTAENPLWLPKRLLFNAFHFGNTNTIRPDQFKLTINQYDPLLGEGYGEMAGRSRSAHKSQGAGTAQKVGASEESFSLLAGMPMTHGLYDGIDTSWSRVGRADIGVAIHQVLDRFRFEQPDAMITPLLAIRDQIKLVSDSFWRHQKLQQIDHIILSCAGVMAEALAGRRVAVPGDSLAVQLRIIARSQMPVSVLAVQTGPQNPTNKISAFTLQSDSLFTVPLSVSVDQAAAPTEPYWMERPVSHYRYQYDPNYGGLPEAPNDFGVTVLLKLQNDTFSMKLPVSYKRLDPLQGDVVARVRIVPPISLAAMNALLIYDTASDNEVALHLQTFQDIDGAVLHASVDERHTPEVQLPALPAGTDTILSLRIPKGFLNGISGGDTLHFSVRFRGEDYRRGLHLIRYDHIPEQQYFTPAAVRLVPKTWKVAASRIGYVEGAGDFVDDVLRLSGLDVEKIPVGSLTDAAMLTGYDAIIIGIRALNTERQLGVGMAGLLRYVAQGGTLVVQYNTNRGLATDHFAPYPISLSRNRVTEEHAKVTILDSRSPLLHFPNEITAKDFEGWVQERGLYFPGTWDARYHTVLSMHDTGEEALSSAVLYAPYGKGHYIYTSLAFFRQLPAGNVGAMKLLMNMLSIGRTPGENPK